MARWIKSTLLQGYDIAIYEQVEWIKNGLPVYNRYGKRLLGSDTSIFTPGDCLIPEKEETTPESFENYIAKKNIYEFFENLQYKRDELRFFLEINNSIDIIEDKELAKILCINQHNSLEPIDNIGVEMFTAQKTNYEPPSNSLEHESLDSGTLIAGRIKTNNSLAIREEKTANDWTKSLEAAVSLAIKCQINGKPKSTAQHQEMWRLLWDAPEGTQPRKSAFAAFRRALPDDLKKGT